MKKLIFISLIAFASCSKSKNDDVSVNYSITGKWYFKETVINGVNIPYDDNEPYGKDYLEFYGTNAIKSIDVFNCHEDTNWIGTYTKNGNNLIIKNGSESLNATILELTNNSLIYKYNYDSDGNGTIDVNIVKFDR